MVAAGGRLPERQVPPARGSPGGRATRQDAVALGHGFDKERNWKILDAVRAVAAEANTTPAAVSLAWLLQQPQVTSTIFGARSIAQLEDNVKGPGARAHRGADEDESPRRRTSRAGLSVCSARASRGPR
ncbi:MAG: aldo/keto reductase [Deltaproteobacteria bacterium]|nr:aldo/keto reductase [Deltaproteobacteria bacterium]